MRVDGLGVPFVQWWNAYRTALRNVDNRRRPPYIQRAQTGRTKINKTHGQNGKATLAELTGPRVWWLLASAIAAALILAFGTLTVIQWLGIPIALFIFGLTLAAALDPLIAWLERRLPRLPAIILVYLVLAILIVALIMAVAPSLAGQVQGFGGRIPDLTERARQFINRWSDNLFGDSLTKTLGSEFSSMGPTLLRLPLTITSTVLDFVVVVFVSFYTLVGVSGMRRFLLSLFPQGQRSHIDELLGSMAEAMGGYIRGVVINGVIVGFLTFLGLLFLGIDFAVVFGVMAGMLELIPVVGPIASASIIVGLTLLQSPTKALEALIFMIVLQQLENHILVPNIMRSQTDISPLLSILALLAGGAIGGLMGALVAIPIAAALRVLVRQVIAPAIRREAGAEPVEADSS